MSLECQLRSHCKCEILNCRIFCAFHNSLGKYCQVSVERTASMHCEHKHNFFLQKV
jgi:hypothetical protein